MFAEAWSQIRQPLKPDSPSLPLHYLEAARGPCCSPEPLLPLYVGCTQGAIQLIRVLEDAMVGAKPLMHHLRAVFGWRGRAESSFPTKASPEAPALRQAHCSIRHSRGTIPLKGTPLKPQDIIFQANNSAHMDHVEEL